MRWLADNGISTRNFLELGGWVMLVILLVTFAMWVLILERWQYLRWGLAADVDAVLGEWRARSERTSWYANQIRRELISRVSQQVHRSIPTIKTLVALCPLLGLLGTVTGMIEVFHVMGFAGTGNPRAMANGVSRATLPTMAGMVAALSGLIISVQLEQRADDATEQVADELSPEA